MSKQYDYNSFLTIACLALIAYIILRLIINILFWLTHRRPLSEDEVTKLANARKCRYINENFRFSSNGFTINPKYRESLTKEGRWDRVSINYPAIATAVAELLRYKRHEWFIWVLTNEKESKYLWANKGDDNKSCYSKANIIQALLLAESNECNTIMMFHNHPHTKERYWNLLSPSETDLNTCNHFKQIFNEMGYNFIDGLVSQGKYIIYGYEFSDKFHPAGSKIEDINQENNVSKKKNYKLHKELRKLKHLQISERLFG